jgi:hypothetical protein
MKFVKNTRYYTGTVYEWNLPVGSTCPFALECKVTVDRLSGKFSKHDGEYRCYASRPERFPAVREHRWKNFEFVKNGGVPVLPKNCKAVRIHASGDFFNQAYFDMWLTVCQNYPDVEFWAYTKSLQYWVNRIDNIPKNLQLTASWGGRQDYLIEQYNLKNAKVVKETRYTWLLDTNDDLARNCTVHSFLLL